MGDRVCVCVHHINPSGPSLFKNNFSWCCINTHVELGRDTTLNVWWTRIKGDMMGLGKTRNYLRVIILQGPNLKFADD